VARAKPKAKPKSPRSGIASTRRGLAERRHRPGAKAGSKARSRARKPQKFTVSRYAKYRDLGIGEATHGMVQAHVIRLVPPCRPEEVSKRHYHDVDFQMVYVLKGWMKTKFEGQGAHVMRAGSAWIQPPRIEHVVLDYSEDCEVLEIIMPAEFATVEV
jgi:hypothetical protein